MQTLSEFPSDQLKHQSTRSLSRLDFLKQTGLGFGALGLAGLVDGATGAEIIGDKNLSRELNPLAPRKGPLPAKAEHVIHIFAQGAPSHVDTWDPKPDLTDRAGKSIPGGKAFASPFKFSSRGKSGTEVSEVFPYLGKVIDEIAVIRSMHTNVPAHALATVMMNTGSLRVAKPSLGAWTLYGLGTMNQNMPGFISLRPGRMPNGGTQNWQSAFLPGVYQGTSINTTETSVDKMIENIRNEYASLAQQRKQLNLVRQFNQLHSARLQKDPKLEATLANYEMAFRMQIEASNAFDLSKEPTMVKKLYGDTTQGRQLMLARRLVERGVRFVQVWAGGWDHHNNLKDRLAGKAKEIDQPAAALIADLRQRGLLEKTLVIWGGEFGRKPTGDGSGNAAGRGHNNRAFSTWLAGGGVKGGTVHGATDELGANAVDDKVHIHDLHATVLRLLGFDHEKLTFRYNGRDFRLTDVEGNVVKNIIA